jgi:hypothetical protein
MKHENATVVTGRSSGKATYQAVCDIHGAVGDVYINPASTAIRFKRAMADAVEHNKVCDDGIEISSDTPIVWVTADTGRIVTNPSQVDIVRGNVVQKGKRPKSSWCGTK